MVIPVETLAELDKLDMQATPGNSVGRFFKYDQIERAKKDGKFDDVRRAVKEIEDGGALVYYMCTDLENEHSKWLFFTIHNAPNATGRPLMQLLISISEGEYIDFDSVEDIEVTYGGGSGSNGGSPSTCPLF